MSITGKAALSSVIWYGSSAFDLSLLFVPLDSTDGNKMSRFPNVFMAGLHPNVPDVVLALRHLLWDQCQLC